MPAEFGRLILAHLDGFDLVLALSVVVVAHTHTKGEEEGGHPQSGGRVVLAEERRSCGA